MEFITSQFMSPVLPPAFADVIYRYSSATPAVP